MVLLLMAVYEVSFIDGLSFPCSKLLTTLSLSEKMRAVSRSMCALSLDLYLAFFVPSGAVQLGKDDDEWAAHELAHS